MQVFFPCVFFVGLRKGSGVGSLLGLQILLQGVVFRGNLFLHVSQSSIRRNASKVLLHVGIRLRGNRKLDHFEKLVFFLEFVEFVLELLSFCLEGSNKILDFGPELLVLSNSLLFQKLKGVPRLVEELLLIENFFLEVQFQILHLGFESALVFGDEFAQSLDFGLLPLNDLLQILSLLLLASGLQDKRVLLLDQFLLALKHGLLLQRMIPSIIRLLGIDFSEQLFPLEFQKVSLFSQAEIPLLEGLDFLLEEENALIFPQQRKVQKFIFFLQVFNNLLCVHFGPGLL